MRIWRFNEDRVDFEPATEADIEADREGLYILQQGDQVTVHDAGEQRPMPERLTVAGVEFDREAFELPLPMPARLSQGEIEDLRAEMRRDGQWMREQLREKGRGMSVRLTTNPLESLAGIDEIINRGDREAFVALLRAIIEQPSGPVADRVRLLYERVKHRAGDPELSAWPQYQAAYWVARAMESFRGGHRRG